MIVFVSAVLGAILAVGAVAIRWRQIQDAEQADRCERSVAARDDNRAVWLYLIERNPDSPELPTFVAFLDERLPALTCDGSHNPVPLGG